MNRQEKIAIIREKVIEVVPEIVELKMGCDVEIVIGSLACPATIVQKNYAGNWLVLIAGQTATYKAKQIYKIIGRPIRLAEILLTVQSPSCGVMEASYELVDPSYGHTWDIRKDDLTLQGEATVDFIYELLT